MIKMLDSVNFPRYTISDMHVARLSCESRTCRVSVACLSVSAACLMFLYLALISFLLSYFTFSPENGLL